MARMPGAEWLGEHGSAVMTEASLNKICLHTIVGYAPAHAAHFSVRADGHIFQSRDTRFQSAANLHGNDDVIAIENEDHGKAFGTWNTNDGHAVPAFTDAQIEANARIFAWGYRTHKIPLVACPNSKDASEGIAYHRQGIDGNFLAEGYRYGGRVVGGEVWTTSPGKVCPGDRRISQIPSIIHRARVLVGLVVEEPDVELTTPFNDVEVNKYPNTVGHTLLNIKQNVLATRTFAATVLELIKADNDDVNVDEIVARVVAAQRDLLEDVIRDVVPDELAEQVVTRLAERLAATA